MDRDVGNPAVPGELQSELGPGGQAAANRAALNICSLIPCSSSTQARGGSNSPEPLSAETESDKCQTASGELGPSISSTSLHLVFVPAQPKGRKESRCSLAAACLGWWHAWAEIWNRAALCCEETGFSLGCLERLPSSHSLGLQIFSLGRRGSGLAGPQCRSPCGDPKGVGVLKGNRLVHPGGIEAAVTDVLNAAWGWY